MEAWEGRLPFPPPTLVTHFLRHPTGHRVKTGPSRSSPGQVVTKTRGGWPFETMRWMAGLQRTPRTTEVQRTAQSRVQVSDRSQVSVPREKKSFTGSRASVKLFGQRGGTFRVWVRHILSAPISKPGVCRSAALPFRECRSTRCCLASIHV